MARIIYGIQSDGLGHYSRSKLVIDHLLGKGHEVKVLTSGRAYEIMKDDYDINKIERISNVYKNNRVQYVNTFYRNFIKFPSLIKDGFRKVRKIFSDFKPDIVISDFEIFSAQIAQRKRVPLLLIDNIHCISHTDVGKHVSLKFKPFEQEQKSLLKLLSPSSKNLRQNFITTFFDAKITRKKTALIPSLIREEILEKRASIKKDYILVYQTSKTNKLLVPSLKSVSKENFVVYGFDKEEKDGNIVFKKTDTSNKFVNDLSHCKAIITNGGFSLMSEGVFLHKPILSNPVYGQFEQIVNATMLEKMGYGRFVEKLSANSIKYFLRKIDDFNRNLVSYSQVDNSESFAKIDSKIEEILNGDRTQ